MYVIFPVEEVLHSAAALSPATSTPQTGSHSTGGVRRPVSFNPNAHFTLYNHQKSYPVSPHSAPSTSWLPPQAQTLDRARRTTASGTRSPGPAQRSGYTSAPVTPNQEQRTWLPSLSLLRKSPSAVNFSTATAGGSSPSGGRASPTSTWLGGGPGGSSSGGARPSSGGSSKAGVRGTKWLSLNCRSCNDKPSTGNRMSEPGLKDVVHPSHSEPLKVHSAVTLKLLKTVAEFTQQLSQIQEQHADQLQQLVETFRKRNAELRKERPGGPSTLFQCWETFLQEVEVDSAVAGEVATALGRQVGRPLLEGTFHRKLQARKCFLQREALENQLDKAGDQLKQTYNNYEGAYQAHLSSPNTMTLASYLEAHNEYVQQLRATNAMTESYYTTVLPQLLQELEDIYTDLSRIIADSIGQATDIVANRAGERSKRYEALTLQCRNVAPSADIAALVRGLGSLGPSPFQRTPFTAPRPPAHLDNHTQALAPTLKDEMVFERLAGLSLRSRHETLRREMADCEGQIRQLQDALDTLLRIQQRSLDANVYNKANELQEDICAKRAEMRQAMLNLAATRAQKDLFSARTDLVPELKDKDRERKASSSTATASTSMKTKWMKALKGLRSNTSNTPGISSSERGGNASSGSTASTSGGTSGSRDSEKDKGSRLYQTVISVMANRKKERGDLPTVVLDSIHVFQEYTYKKITPCDACSQILRGHSRQGLKCRFCKQNVHVDCQDRLGKCLAKSKLLRRQKSTPEIEAKTITSPEEEQEMDQIYAVLKQAGELSGKKSVPGSLEKDMEGQGLQQPPVPPSHVRSGLGDAPMSSTSNLRKGGGSTGRIQGSQHSLAVHSTVALHASSSEGYGLASPPPSGTGHWGSPRMQNLKLGPMKSLSADWEDTHTRAALVSVQPYSFRSHPHTPHSPRRHKLNLRMKSFSLDSPESSDLAQRQRCHPSTSAHVVTSSGSVNAVGSATGGSATGTSGHGSTTYCQSPSSPVHNRRLLSARNMRMNSVELPDDNEKSLSSASNSPCPSPKPHRLLPTNLYVVLFNFKARQPDELDLKAGYKVTVVDTSDPDWWQGKCLGRTGYFPSQYVTKLIPGERPLQMTHNIQLSSDAEPAGLKLLRDQIVIQVSEETDGSVMVRTGDNKQALCPLQYLQEV